MVRAYFLSGSYDQAEAALEEPFPSISISTANCVSPLVSTSCKYQAPDHYFIRKSLYELRWLKLKQRKAGDPALLDAYKSLIDHMLLSEASITETSRR
ncbi:hypothetical protein BD779DRAFT_818580 [Infundibulicybe gibba]|nr:hypothetical protein BD779DRAFT_818580 [Infundibulicybe gibba]